MNYKRMAIYGAVILALFLGMSYLTRSCGNTVPIETRYTGTNVIAGVSSLRPCRIGGSDQWLLIRGENTNHPVLLYLAGGPGLSELAWLRTYNSDLEKRFIVVNWDQRGAGKSYEAFHGTNLSFQTYLSDTLEVIDLLRKEFHRDKIYLAGHGFGSLLGIYTARDHPEKIEAYIGIGQMVAPAENDRLSYREILSQARKSGETNAVKELETIGMPPYSGSNLNESYAVLNGWINRLNISRPYTNDYLTNWMRTVIIAPEYSSSDRRNFWKGYFRVFSVIYPQLNRIDIRKDVRRVDVPVYLISGKYDSSADPELTRSFFNSLKAPVKKFVVFDRSGSSPQYEENARFQEFMEKSVLNGGKKAE